MSAQGKTANHDQRRLHKPRLRNPTHPSTNQPRPPTPPHSIKFAAGSFRMCRGHRHASFDLGPTVLLAPAHPSPGAGEYLGLCLGGDLLDVDLRGDAGQRGQVHTVAVMIDQGGLPGSRAEILP